MVWIFKEKPDSGATTEDPRTETLRFVCGRHGDSAYIRAYAIAATPVILNGLFRQDITTKPLGGGMWDVESPYGALEPPKIGEYRIRFDTTGGTVRVTQAKEHIGHFPTGGDGHKGAINVARDGRAEGVDMVIPQFQWQEDWTFSTLVANWAYASVVLKALTGMVNDATFRTFPAGQVRFDGAVGGVSSQDPDQVSLNYQFVQQDDVTNITVGDITGVSKAGWQYSWVEYEDDDDNVKNKPVVKPSTVHVERLYDAADFGLLGIGS